MSIIACVYTLTSKNVKIFLDYYLKPTRNYPPHLFHAFVKSLTVQ